MKKMIGIFGVMLVSLNVFSAPTEVVCTESALGTTSELKFEFTSSDVVFTRTIGGKVIASYNCNALTNYKNIRFSCEIPAVKDTLTMYEFSPDHSQLSYQNINMSPEGKAFIFDETTSVLPCRTEK